MAIARKTRIVILGDKGVGKTALVVRCLTRRFLPEYQSGCDSCHTFQTTINKEQVRMEIIDCSKNKEFALSLADGFIIVYSITDAESLRKARKLARDIREKNMNNTSPIVLLGNKRDLDRYREVSREKAAQTAKRLRCNLFCELSVANDISSVRNIFCELHKRIERKNQKNVVAGKTRKQSALFMMMKVLSTVKNNVLQGNQKSLLHYIENAAVRSVSGSQRSYRRQTSQINSSL
eukprot:gene172-784_t